MHTKFLQTYKQINIYLHEGLFLEHYVENISMQKQAYLDVKSCTEENSAISNTVRDKILDKLQSLEYVSDGP